MLVCVTDTRNVSISLTVRTKDSSPQLTSSKFWKWGICHPFLSLLFSLLLSWSLSFCLSFIVTHLSSLYLIDPCSCFSSLQSINVHIDENALHEILNEVDLNKNGQVEIDEFLQVRNKQTVSEESDEMKTSDISLFT